MKKAILALFITLAFASTFNAKGNDFTTNPTLSPGLFEFVDTSCGGAIAGFNKGIKQLINNVQTKSNEWLVYSDLDALDGFAYHLQNLCNPEDYQLTTKLEAGQTPEQQQACSNLLTILGSLLDQNQPQTFKSGYEQGLAWSQQALTFGPSLTKGCKISVEVKAEAQAEAHAAEEEWGWGEENNEVGEHINSSDDSDALLDWNLNLFAQKESHEDCDSDDAQNSSDNSDDDSDNDDDNSDDQDSDDDSEDDSDDDSEDESDNDSDDNNDDQDSDDDSDDDNSDNQDSNDDSEDDSSDTDSDDAQNAQDNSDDDSDNDDDNNNAQDSNNDSEDESSDADSDEDSDNSNEEEWAGEEWNNEEWAVTKAWDSEESTTKAWDSEESTTKAWDNQEWASEEWALKEDWANGDWSDWSSIGSSKSKGRPTFFYEVNPNGNTDSGSDWMNGGYQRYIPPGTGGNPGGAGGAGSSGIPGIPGIPSIPGNPGGAKATFLASVGQQASGNPWKDGDYKKYYGGDGGAKGPTTFLAKKKKDDSDASDYTWTGDYKKYYDDGTAGDDKPQKANFFYWAI